MTEWIAKRFWKETTLEHVEGAYRVLLDGRPVKTPGRQVFEMPSSEMAAAARLEWEAQSEVIDPNTMPVTRSVNSALDQTAPQREAVIDMLAAYGETDLLCHRASHPESLVSRQAEAWDPLLAWTLQQFDAPLVVTEGIIPQDQDPDSLLRLKKAVSRFGNFGLTGLYDLIGISGSLVIGLAVADGMLDPKEAWGISRIDDDHQIAQWGADEEAEAQAASRNLAFLHAARFVKWSGTA